jgi:hypothetical protein
MVLLDLTRLTDGQIPAAFAWKIKEDLLPNSTTVSDLKFRVGYGITGQEMVIK